MLRTLAPGQWPFIWAAMPWPFVFITEPAELSSLSCKPCAIHTVCEHYTVPSPLVSAGCFTLHGSELSWAVCVVTTTAAHWHVLAAPHWAMPLLRCRKKINPLGFVKVVYLFCLNFNEHLIKYLYFSTFMVSSNELDEMVHGLHFCGGMVIEPKVRASNPVSKTAW